LIPSRHTPSDNARAPESRRLHQSTSDAQRASKWEHGDSDDSDLVGFHVFERLGPHVRDRRDVHGAVDTETLNGFVSGRVDLL